MLHNISINKPLLLEVFHFDELNNNIDWLCKYSLTSTDYNLKHQYLTKAANLCEKFHSYFHFEQSFFHLNLAEKLYTLNQLESAIPQYEQAIFQDHLNQLAHIRLIECYKITNQPEKLEEQLNYIKRLNIDINNYHKIISYQRPFNKYIDYLKFATESKFINISLDNEQLRLLCPYDYLDGIEISKLPTDNFWLGWLKYNLTNSLADLEETIKLVKIAHDLYHQNSAKIYYNRHLVYKALDKLDLANNDLIKSRNLFADL